MPEHQLQKIFLRIDKLTENAKGLWGQMNVNQMICHCSDQIRCTLGTKKALEYGKVDPKEIMVLARSGKTIPTPKGFDQIKGEGTEPTSFENDREILKSLIIEFSKTDQNFDFPPHPYFGKVDRKQWTNLILNHLDHHLGQFGT